MSQIADAPTTGLRKNYVSFIEDLAQSVGASAPSGGIAAIVPLIFATAGNATWFLFVLVLIAYLPITFCLNVFASRLSSSGSFYTYVEEGLGRFWGQIGGWCYLVGMVFGLTDAGLVVIHYCMVLSGSSASVALAIGCAAIMLPCVWWLACRDIRLSTDTTFRLECVSIGAMLILAVLYLVRSGHAIDAPQIHLEGMTMNGLRLALVLAFFAPAGYESSTTLGVESTDATRSIPRALLMSLVPILLLNIFIAYILVACFRGVTPSLDQAESPFHVLAAASGLPIFGPIMTACFAISFFACVVAALNAAGRIVYSMAREKQFAAAAGTVHKTHATPQIAITSIMIFSTAVAAILTVCGISIMDAFNYTAQIGSFGFLASYLMVCIAAPFFLHKRGELRKIHVVMSVLGVIFLALPIFGSLYPVPQGPEKYLPYVFFASLCLGVAYSRLIAGRYRKKETAAMALS
jgi:amino acid transporter